MVALSPKWGPNKVCLCVHQGLCLVCQKISGQLDDELKVGDVRYDNMTKITIKVQLF